jgi:predicted membrane channel-forming protein YqfA (hemolysin III family)
MATKKSKKNVYFFILLTVVGCVLACSSIITNDYLKLVVVMVSLCVGLFGIMKSLSNPASKEE